jgi:hypothetical protein
VRAVTISLDRYRVARLLAAAIVGALFAAAIAGELRADPRRRSRARGAVIACGRRGSSLERVRPPTH